MTKETSYYRLQSTRDTAVDHTRPITDTDSVLCTLKDRLFCRAYETLPQRLRCTTLREQKTCLFTYWHCWKLIVFRYLLTQTPPTQAHTEKQTERETDGDTSTLINTQTYRLTRLLLISFGSMPGRLRIISGITCSLPSRYHRPLASMDRATYDVH